jgi:hypothetical protein
VCGWELVLERRIIDNSFDSIYLGCSISFSQYPGYMCLDRQCTTNTSYSYILNAVVGLNMHLHLFYSFRRAAAARACWAKRRAF